MYTHVCISIYTEPPNDTENGKRGERERRSLNTHITRAKAHVSSSVLLIFFQFYGESVSLKVESFKVHKHPLIWMPIFFIITILLSLFYLLLFFHSQFINSHCKKSIVSIKFTLLYTPIQRWIQRIDRETKEKKKNYRFECRSQYSIFFFCNRHCRAHTAWGI